jgi:hypothetical protein
LGAGVKLGSGKVPPKVGSKTDSSIGLAAGLVTPTESESIVIPACLAFSSNSASLVFRDGAKVPRLKAEPKILDTLVPTAFSARSIIGNFLRKSGSLAALATTL